MEVREADVEELQRRLRIMQDIVYPAISEAVQEKQKKANKALTLLRGPVVDFAVGSWVMARDPRRKGKLAPIFEGPFKVMRRTTGGSYLLEDTDGTLLNRRFAPSQLTLITPPEEIIQATSYVVEAILSHRGSPGAYEYLVKWLNYDNSANEWIPFEQFNDTEIIRQYWAVQEATQPKQINNSQSQKRGKRNPTSRRSLRQRKR